MSALPFGTVDKTKHTRIALLKRLWRWPSAFVSAMACLDEVQSTTQMRTFKILTREPKTGEASSSVRSKYTPFWNSRGTSRSRVARRKKQDVINLEDRPTDGDDRDDDGLLRAEPGSAGSLVVVVVVALVTVIRDHSLKYGNSAKQQKKNTT